MLLITILIQLITIFFLCLYFKDKVLKITFCIFNIAFFLYSGLGIYNYDLADKYYVSYIVATITLNVCFVLGHKLYCLIFERKKVQSGVASTKMEGTNLLLEKKADWLKLFFYFYLFLRIFGLFYPEFYLKYLFAGPNFIYSNLLEATNESYNTTLGHLLSTLKTILLPFAYIYLSKCSNKAVIGFFVFDVLASYLAGRASVSRLAIIQALITVCLIIYGRSKTKKQKRNRLILLVGAIIFSFVIYVFILNLRNGEEVSIFSINPMQAIKDFVQSEFFYPRNYPLADKLSQVNAYDPKKFWLWLVTLPIPKMFFSIPGVDTTTSIIYRVFSYHYFGGYWYYEQNVGGMLLSLLGDGIMVYGWKGAFIIIIPFALFVSFFISYIRNIKNGEILYYYALFKIVVTFRPGVQYALTMINTFISILVILLILKIFKDIKVSDFFKK